jgi:hypothetical protein
VVIRYLRSRVGDLRKQDEDCLGLGRGARNVILDHCSATWSTDEALSLAGDVGNATIQWCLIAEALNQSKHTKGAHGYGSLVRANGPVSLHHNLWAHNDSRNPRLGDNYGRAPYPVFDVRNNVIYDYGAVCSGLTQGRFNVNYVGNYIRPGPTSKARTPVHLGSPSQISFYIRDNVFEGNEALTADNRRFIGPPDLSASNQVRIVEKPFELEPVRTIGAREAFEVVLNDVGASLPRRDSVDTRIVDQVRTRRGRIIDSQDEVGGWPELKSGKPPADIDRDGMPDDWEKSHALDSTNGSDGGSDKDGDGYTALEEYLNRTDPNRFIDYRDSRNNVSSINWNLTPGNPVRAALRGRPFSKLFN